jgi:hypothetical protein
MSNRASRRASISRFRKIARGSLTTYCLAPDALLDEYPLLDSARRQWLGSISTRRPICIRCKEAISVVGAVLLVEAEGSSMVGCSGFCSGCWAEATDEDLERSAVLMIRRQVMRNAAFEG